MKELLSKDCPKNYKELADKQHKEAEANRARAIAEAIQAGTIRPCARWDELDLYKKSIATRLSNEPDILSAMATLDGVLQRQVGKYILYLNGSVGQNTTDTQILKNLISIEVVGLLSDKANKQRVEYYLNRWKEQQPTPIEKRTPPRELLTPEATKLIERATDARLIENTPEGLKWTGTMQLLAYMAYLATPALQLPTKRYNRGNNKDVQSTCWRPFEKLFGLKKDTLKGVKQDWDKWHDEWPNEKPKGYEKIEALFK